MSFTHETPSSYNDTFHLGHESLHYGLFMAEEAPDRKEAVTSLAEALNRACQQFIDDETPFVASGVFITKEPSGAMHERYQELQYGTITAIEPINVLESWYVAAKMELEAAEDNMGYLLLSTGQGTRFSLVPDYPTSFYTADQLTDWREKAHGCETVEDFMRSAGQHFTGSQLTTTVLEELQKVEQVLREHYGVAICDYASVEGSLATVHAGEGMAKTELRADGAYSGDFEGLTLRPFITEKGQAGTQLCIALRQPDTSMVLQPCQSLVSFNTVSV